ncbi:S8 family peptidase [Pedobacter punctiformis]|uniref:S8 family peptidase n=1 Tax=Pedobacter punctiformis TaxID=3004097 RepID=A0ABT4LCK9_9SPHI|nr:S8 family peptidase [Pedobacter sp. HCMS5-2]MCZ4245447.1 S8 family peptidase [Pedobacter sp. HCMS5-2]
MMNSNLKKLMFFIFFLCLQTLSFAQSKKVQLPANWHNLDLLESGFFGISTEKAYREVLKDKKPKEKIIVAVIDGGVDINHEDLKDVLWTNTKEIPGNGIDDDGNGYVDDVHGWNFIGSKKGNLQFDNLELVRLLRIYTPKYQSTTNLTPLDSTQKEEFRLYKKMVGDFGKKYEDASNTFSVLIAINKVLDSVAKINNKKIPSLEDIDRYKADDETEEQVKTIIRKGAKEDGSFEKFYKNIKDGYEQYDAMLKYNLNPKYDKRAELVGDDYSNANQRDYGNNDVKGPDAVHGTHVSGIIGANRVNNVGIIGVADYVSIMAIRVVPTGDERDKDVANGIRYAVDNGAKVINMSFGKGYKWDKKAVDEAIKYAETKGVLLVHAAGNDNQNNDVDENYPNKYFDSKEAEDYKIAHKVKARPDFVPPKNIAQNGMGMRPPLDGRVIEKPLALDSAKFNLPHAKNWIEVGASAYKDDDNLKADFSNYGKYTVDVFAPGFLINSTIPDSKYEDLDGTSMASPVVAGLAALILSYHPDFTPVQVKDIIMKSVSKVNHKIKYKNEKGENVRVFFSEICVSGGIVNTYNALKLAETYKK